MHINLELPFKYSLLTEKENVIEIVSRLKYVENAEIFRIKVGIDHNLFAGFVRNLNSFKFNEFFDTVGHPDENVKVRPWLLG